MDLAEEAANTTATTMVVDEEVDKNAEVVVASAPATVVTAVNADDTAAADGRRYDLLRHCGRGGNTGRRRCR